jgi:hypothetical protein
MLRIDIHRWFAMAAILNPKWGSKYKNPSIWAKFGFQVDFDVGELISMIWEPYYDPLCRNIHRSIWQLLGGFQNGSHYHGNQGTKWPPNTKILRFGRNLVSK